MRTWDVFRSSAVLLCVSLYERIYLSFPGTTCLVALLSEKQLTVANIGDSRAVLCDKDSSAILLSRDHKPYQLKERKRIKKAGASAQPLQTCMQKSFIIGIVWTFELFFRCSSVITINLKTCVTSFHWKQGCLLFSWVLKSCLITFKRFY